MNQRGIINVIVLIIIALILVDYFKVDLRKLFVETFSQENIQYTWNLVKDSIDSAINR